MGFDPTPEQTRAVELFGSGESMKIEAGAGTGKTATLELIARSTRERGQYVAFNKSIVVEAGDRMPGNVVANTAHSLAYRAVGKDFGRRLRSGRMRSDEIARILDVGPFVVNYGGQSKRLSPGFLAGLVMKGIERFCQTADPVPSARRHLPYLDGIDVPNPDGSRRYEWNDKLRDSLEGALGRAWADLQRTDREGGGRVPFRHEHYLKLWQLSSPRIEADFILFDEAQDANPVMAAVVGAQDHAQRVYVGDSQQAIYEFTGAVNALAGIDAGHTSFLTQSFRFGPAVADVANLVLGRLGAELLLSGSPDRESVVVDDLASPAAILCRTNAQAMRTILTGKAADLSVHLIGGGKEVSGFAKAAGALMSGRSTQHPDLACFASWGEVVEYVEHDEQGSDLKMLVGLVEEFTVETILSALDRMPAEAHAQLVVSTAHKAKGREWSSVRLADDFVRETKDGEVRTPETSELRLLYVAVTRAQEILDDSAVRVLYAPKKKAEVS